MVWPQILAAALPAVIGGISSALGAKKQNEAAKDASQAQMDFQWKSDTRQMAFQRNAAQSQYQWAMGDMRKAGLNPILAYRQGGSGNLSGSSSAGASYSPVNVGASAASGAVSAASTALAQRRFRLEERMNIAAIDKLYTGAAKDSADADLATHQRMNVQQQRQLLRQEYLMRKPDVSSAKHAEELYKGPFGSFFKWWQMLKRGHRK